MGKWEEYTIEDNVLFINDKLSNGVTMREIEEKYYNVGQRVITKRLTRKGYKRAKDGNRLFVLVHSNKDNVKPTKAKNDNDNVKAKAKVENKSTNKLSDEEINQLRELLEIKDKLVGMVSDTNDTQDIDNINIIQSKETKQKMFRIDVEVLERWNKFVQDHSHIKVQNLVSSALDFYMKSFEE